MNTEFDKLIGLQNSGCPYCGNPAVNLIMSDLMGNGFRCDADQCPSKGHIITLRKFSKMMLPKKYAEMRKVAFSLTQEIEKTKAYINEVLKEIQTIKRVECKKRSAYCLVCKQRYEEIKNLKLFDKQRNRIHASNSPYGILDPKTNKLIEVWSINSKRRAKALLSFRWFEARERLAASVRQLTSPRMELQEHRNNLKQMQLRVQEIENDKGFKNALVDQKKKGVKA